MTITDTYTQAQADAKFFQTANAFLAGKNKIINGDFAINQRNFTTDSVGGFGFDRFICAFSGATATATAQTFTPGTAPVTGYEAKNFLRLATTTGNDFCRVSQPIESVRTFAGQTATLSFWAKGTNPTTAGNLRVRLQQVFGTGGSANVDIAEQTFVLTANWTRYSFTFAVPSIAGKTIGTDGTDKLSVDIGQLSSTSTDSWTLDLWGVQMEAGSIATPFQTATGTIQGELAACQRYFAKSYAQSVAPGTANGDGIPAFFQATSVANNTPYGILQFPVTMRAAPTITCYSYNGTVTVASRVNDGVDLSANTAAATTTNQFGSWVRNLNASTFTSSQGAMFHYIASAEL
jgi:hypothetical protein